MPKEILPGLYRIKIPLPETPLGSVNSYLITSAERSLLIDTGMNRQECLHKMRAALGELEVDLNATDFFITHWHIDHLDLVSALATPSSRIYLNRIEAEALAHGVGRRWQQFVPFARQHGFPDEELQDMLTTHPPKYGPTEDLDFSIVGAGDVISAGDYTFVCLETPGHSPGHLCLYESNRKILVPGDHLLLEITPNVALWSDKVDRLKQYLESLDRVYDLDVQLVLPGHGRTFRDHRRRIRELKRHHEARTNEILAILKDRERTIYEVASRMTWNLSCESWEEFPAFQKWFAFGETFSHMVYLEEKAMVGRRMGDQVVFYCK